MVRRILAFFDYLKRLPARTWLFSLIVLLTIPILVSTILPRKTAFRIIAETQIVTGFIEPSQYTHTQQISYEDAFVCADQSTAITPDLEQINECAGFAVGLASQDAQVVLNSPVDFTITRQEEGLTTVTLIPEGAEELTECSRPTVEIVNAGNTIDPNVDVLEFLEDTEDQSPIFLCGIVRILIKQPSEAHGTWLALDGRYLVIGSDASPNSYTIEPSLKSGHVEMYGVGFFKDLFQAFRPTLTPQGGYIPLGQFSLNFADAVRLIAHDKDQRVNFHLVAGMQSDHLKISTWSVSPRAIVTAYGSQGYVLKPTVIDRFLNDPLLSYWAAATFGLFMLWVRATIFQFLRDQGMINAL